MPDHADTPSVDDLLARAERHREWTGSIDPGTCFVCRENWPCAASGLAAALRAQTAETDEVRRGSQVVIHELQSQVRNYTNALGEARAETEKLRTAIYGCGCPAPYTECPHDEPFGVQIARQHTELVEALDRLDENEGTIAALRQQLAEAREHDEQCESEFLNPPGAHTPCGCRHRRAAAPSPARGTGSDPGTYRGDDSDDDESVVEAPLWRSEISCEDASLPTDYGTGIEHGAYWTWAIFDGPDDPDDLVLCGTSEIDPTTVVQQIIARHNRADQTPAGITREQIVDAIEDLWRDLYPAMPDDFSPGNLHTIAWRSADAVLALIHGEGNQ